MPYDQVSDMEDINAEFGQADVAIILGANDVVNPAAHTKGCPIDGMPILEADGHRQQALDGRGLCRPGQRALRHGHKIMLVFGDAKKVVEDMSKAIE